MSTEIALLLLFGIGWPMLILATRIYNRRRAEKRAFIAEPQTRHGFRFTFNRLVKHHASNERDQDREFVEYVVALPPAIGMLSIIDAEAFQLRTTNLGSDSLDHVGRPDTSDDVFDGLFDFTRSPSPASARALNIPEIRQALMNLNRAFELGVWVDYGNLRIVERGRPDEDDIDITLELLVGELLAMRDGLRRAGYDVDDDEHVFVDSSHESDETADLAESEEVAARPSSRGL